MIKNEQLIKKHLSPLSQWDMDLDAYYIHTKATKTPCMIKYLIWSTNKQSKLVKPKKGSRVTQLCSNKQQNMMFLLIFDALVLWDYIALLLHSWTIY